MEEQGLLQKRTEAPSLHESQAPPLAPEQRYGEGSPEGRAIAQLAVSYVRERDTLFIGEFAYLLIAEVSSGADALNDRDQLHACSGCPPRARMD